MDYIMSVDDASRLEALNDVCKVGAQRTSGTTLTNIELRFTTEVMEIKGLPPTTLGHIRAVATDSYRLVRWDFTTHTEGGDDDSIDYVNDTTLLINGDALARAIKALRTSKPRVGKAAIKLTPYEDSDTGDRRLKLDVEAIWDTEIGLVTLTASDATFPKWKQLVPTGTRGSKIIDKETLRNMQPADGQQASLPAFDAEKLASVWKLLGMTNAVRKDFKDVQLTHTTLPSKQAGAYLRPWVWSAVNRDTSFSLVLMPINTGEHDNKDKEDKDDTKG